MSTPLVFGPDGIDDEQIVGKPPPSTRFLNWLHTRVSTNGPEDTHHRLGYGPTEAAPGNHTHDGRDSLPIAGVADLTDQVSALEALALANLNRIINGNFGVNQRGAASGTSLGSSVYFLDRWQSGSSSNPITFTGDEFGRVVTVGSGKILRQRVEQGNVPAGTYTLAHDGTAQMRLYKSGTTAPSFAAGPVTATLDGLANAIIEFTDGTVSNVRLLPGSTAYPFIPRLVSEELALCQRYFYLLLAGDAICLNPYRGVALSGANLRGEKHPVTMRAAPTLQVAPTDPFPNALNFDFLSEAAGAAASRILVNASSTAVRLIYNYGSGNNGGSTLPAGYLSGANTKALWVSAEL